MGENSELLDDFVVRVRFGNVHTIASIRRSLDSWLAGCRVPPERAGDVLLACYEAMANVVEHAYQSGEEHELVVHACHFDRGLSVTIVDHGAWQTPPNDSGYRGRGLQLMTALSDKADIRIENDGTRVELEWDLVTGPAM